MRILWDNKAIDADLTEYSQNPDYPVENIQDTRLSRYYRSLDENEQYIIIDGGVGITASYIAIFNHNLTSGATIRLEGGDEDSNDDVDWDNPSVRITIPWTEYYLIREFTEQTHDRWRLYFDDPDNQDEYIKIGFVYLGTYLQMPPMKRDQEIPVFTESYRTIGTGGQAYGDKNYRYRNPKVKFSYLSQDDKDNITEMWEEVENVTPIVLLIWADRFDIETPMYCLIDQNMIMFKKTNSDNLPFTTEMKFREVF